MIEKIRSQFISLQGQEFPRPVAGTAVVDRQGRLALVYSTYGGQGWHFPKGGVDEGESEAEAATKELSEEAGLYANPVSEQTFGVRGGTFTQSLGFGSPRVQPPNLIHHPICDFFGNKVEIGTGPKTTGHISLGALRALELAAQMAGFNAEDIFPNRHQLFDECKDLKVLWRQKPVYLVASFQASDPRLLTGETEAVRWWPLESLTGVDSPVHPHVKELVRMPQFLELVGTAKARAAE